MPKETALHDALFNAHHLVKEVVNLFVEDYKGKDMNILPVTSSSLIGSSGEFIVAFVDLIYFNTIQSFKLYFLFYYNFLWNNMYKSTNLHRYIIILMIFLAMVDDPFINFN